MKRYKITPQMKKSVVECEYFNHSELPGSIEVAVCWRGGEYYVNIDNEDDQELMDYHLEHLDEMFEVTSFSDWELDHTFDGCSEDLYYHGTHLTEEDQEDFTERYWDHEDGGFSYLEENGWHPNDMEIFIHNGVIIEEISE